MSFVYYTVDERLLPWGEGAEDESVTPETVIAAVERTGGEFATVAGRSEELAAAFEALDEFAGGEGLLPEMAYSGSPGLVLTGRPGHWRLGYFEASLVEHLHGAFRLQREDVEEALGGLPEAARGLGQAFLEALDDAKSRGLAVAIVHA